MLQNPILTDKNEYLEQSYGQLHDNYQRNTQFSADVIEGYFPKENIRKEMSIRRINTTLTIMLGLSILITAVSYYFATANEMVLNNLSRQTVILNDENSDLQNKLDRLKSFNNVDISMQKSNLLQKAQQVLEVQAVSSTTVADKKVNPEKPFTWAIGY